jgi:Histidine kinase-, DNA gyrase B-, and HSP90-like ATPase
MTNPVAPPNEELVYAPAVLILSQDLYPRKLEIVREYIQNASDAIDTFAAVADIVKDTSESLIKISIQGKSLLIFDNGIGMDEEDVSKLRRIAYSEKKAGEEAGYKGIGKLAGIAVAEKLKISSTSYGDPKLHHFEFRAKDMREEISKKKKQGVIERASDVIHRHTTLESTDIDRAAHFTMVELRGITDSCPELLDPHKLKEYIGDIAPVDFSPDFKWGARLSQHLRQNVPDYSPKTVYLTKRNGERVKVYKPYDDSMMIAEPEYIEVHDSENLNNTLALCWYATKGQEVLGQIRPAGKIFSVDDDGDDPRAKKRFAGLAYKLFGFSVGDRSLSVRTLWGQSAPRALWFTGEIHIIDKEVFPTTDRSDFIESDARDRLYKAGQRIPNKLNKLAQEISNNRNAYRDGEKFSEQLQDWNDRLKAGKIERAELRSIRDQLHRNLSVLKDRVDQCSDQDVKQYDKDIQKFAVNFQKELEEAQLLKGDNGIADVAGELEMTGKARKVFQIIMEALESHFSNDPETYYDLLSKISTALRKKY